MRRCAPQLIIRCHCSCRARHANHHRLRNAITRGDTAIALPACAIEFNNEIAISSGEQIAIAGEGEAVTTLSGGRRARIFAVLNNTWLTLSDLTLANGTSSVESCITDSRYGCSGAAVYVLEARLTLLRCTVRDNAAFVRTRSEMCVSSVGER